jgi:hypothetical protein
MIMQCIEMKDYKARDVLGGRGECQRTYVNAGFETRQTADDSMLSGL